MIAKMPMEDTPKQLLTDPSDQLNLSFEHFANLCQASDTSTTTRNDLSRLTLVNTEALSSQELLFFVLKVLCKAWPEYRRRLTYVTLRSRLIEAQNEAFSCRELYNSCIITNHEKLFSQRNGVALSQTLFCEWAAQTEERWLTMWTSHSPNWTALTTCHGSIAWWSCYNGRKFST